MFLLDLVRCFLKLLFNDLSDVLRRVLRSKDFTEVGKPQYSILIFVVFAHQKVEFSLRHN